MGGASAGLLASVVLGIDVNEYIVVKWLRPTLVSEPFVTLITGPTGNDPYIRLGFLIGVGNIGSAFGAFEGSGHPTDPVMLVTSSRAI